MIQQALLGLLARLRPATDAGGPGQTRERQPAGFSIAIAVVTAIVVVIGLMAIVSRSSNSFLGGLWQSDFRNAREGAEYGIGELIAQLNQERNSYLLVTEWNCWPHIVATDIDGSVGNVVIYGAVAQADRLQGVSSNSTIPGQWTSLPTGAVTTASDGSVTGTGIRYQLEKYTAPRPTDGTTEPGAGSCPAAGSLRRFSNLFGGSATIRVKAEAYRNSQLVATDTLDAVVHVRSSPAFGINEGAIIILGSYSEIDLAKGNFYSDVNSNGVRDSGEPYINIFCVLCTASQAATLSASYGGDVYSGNYYRGIFPFWDKNANGYLDGTDSAFPQEIDSANPVYTISPKVGANGGSGSTINDQQVTVTSANGSGMLVDLQYCTTITTPADSLCGALGRVKSATIVGTGSGYLDGESVTVPAATAKTSAAVSLVIGSRAGKLTGSYPDYPYTSSSHSDLRPECSSVTDSTGQNYIGCAVETITGEVTVRTDITGTTPVKLFLVGNIVIKGNDSLQNHDYPKRPASLQLFGLPALPGSPQACNAQEVTVRGVSSMKGFFLWMPRGTLTYNGNTTYAGAAWVCKFAPNNSNASTFLGSNITSLGGLAPLGAWKYRAIGISKVGNP